ncbi:hypothetical protein HBI56_044350 [Parastagonospora nodorum]|uniref:Uncharacterized protein n=1 Tax=Phaeosphaeria nodorum (strain SN15 / ATCC MYA-4574 / FGSC 10173) TaxID=321614 RepID=A0A7U2HUY3_PHANO|nr:hypothetical protein HBH56_057480 [Parastagonospora nodorum]QRC91648.1 hypothetical protein JI435_401490 [Parastagonospora nodorum SN15]KAH3931137.1 hypothetical protein HBH54_101410 [Parastagonospora nodorum]KAH3943851.1 hypothetical protein HBH53_168430 [Parastagonospora nodorum]KAH3965329.1 hypothetical protein HBH51_149970 [Parastagonospora nodorum]
MSRVDAIDSFVKARPGSTASGENLWGFWGEEGIEKGEDGIQTTFVIHTTLESSIPHISMHRQITIQFQAVLKPMQRFNGATCC